MQILMSISYNFIDYITNFRRGRSNVESKLKRRKQRVYVKICSIDAKLEHSSFNANFSNGKNFKQLASAANSYADMIVSPFQQSKFPSCKQVISFEAHFSFGSVTIRKTVRPFSAIKLNSRVNSREREDRHWDFKTR